MNSNSFYYVDSEDMEQQANSCDISLLSDFGSPFIGSVFNGDRKSNLSKQSITKRKGGAFELLMDEITNKIPLVDQLQDMYNQEFNSGLSQECSFRNIQNNHSTKEILKLSVDAIRALQLDMLERRGELDLQKQVSDQLIKEKQNLIAEFESQLQTIKDLNEYVNTQAAEINRQAKIIELRDKTFQNQVLYNNYTTAYSQSLIQQKEEEENKTSQMTQTDHQVFLKGDVDMILLKIQYLENENNLLNLKNNEMQELLNNKTSSENMDSFNNSSNGHLVQGFDEKILIQSVQALIDEIIKVQNNNNNTQQIQLDLNQLLKLAKSRQYFKLMVNINKSFVNYIESNVNRRYSTVSVNTIEANDGFIRDQGILQDILSAKQEIMNEQSKSKTGIKKVKIVSQNPEYPQENFSLSYRNQKIPQIQKEPLKIQEPLGDAINIRLTPDFTEQINSKSPTVLIGNRKPNINSNSSKSLKTKQAFQYQNHHFKIETDTINDCLQVQTDRPSKQTIQVAKNQNLTSRSIKDKSTSRDRSIRSKNSEQPQNQLCNNKIFNTLNNQFTQQRLLTNRRRSDNCDNTSKSNATPTLSQRIQNSSITPRYNKNINNHSNVANSLQQFIEQTEELHQEKKSPTKLSKRENDQVKVNKSPERLYRVDSKQKEFKPVVTQTSKISNKILNSYRQEIHNQTKKQQIYKSMTKEQSLESGSLIPQSTNSLQNQQFSTISSPREYTQIKQSSNHSKNLSFNRFKQLMGKSFVPTQSVLQSNESQRSIK
ncbi:UNKNOWN [Stylonychia lemnae]|uniref:Uncharacterized protein n=1 Tax=Stylonychia lemnae TaxID=5949 RepID=A0A078AKF1_STYLE|nr:UNKNOWN [Stylonychia lemnae]|eukprot:CDW82689.1 UNKNOWN [Stylonychia lemnae]